MDWSNRSATASWRRLTSLVRIVNLANVPLPRTTKLVSPHGIPKTTTCLDSAQGRWMPIVDRGGIPAPVFREDPSAFAVWVHRHHRRRRDFALGSSWQPRRSAKGKAGLATQGLRTRQAWHTHTNDPVPLSRSLQKLVCSAVTDHLTCRPCVQRSKIPMSAPRY